MAVIAFFHNALGKTDGVSLEVEKWAAVLSQMGHKVLYCAGNDDVEGIYCIPELSFNHPLTYKILKNGTVAFVDYASEDDFLKDIQKQAEIIKQKLLDFIKEQKVEILIPNNLLSVGYNIPAVLALSDVIEETRLPTICHNHDFYFEESGEVTPTCAVVGKIFSERIPPAFPNVKNVVINRLAQQALLQKRGLSAMVVPNVFDFTQTPWVTDDYNRGFRKDFGIGETDIVFLQATRILDRKGVELAIETLSVLNRPENRKIMTNRFLYNGKRFSEKDRLILLCSGYVEKFGISGSYQENLVAKAQECGVEIRFIGDRIRHMRGLENGVKIYSLWDSYVQADFVTYPSLWEGWGNQLIEAIFAKVPVLIFEYPVFVSDLKEAGFDLVSLGSDLSGRDARGLARVTEETTVHAAEKIIGILLDKDQREKMVNGNFQIAKERYSFETLQKCIQLLLK